MSGRRRPLVGALVVGLGVFAVLALSAPGAGAASSPPTQGRRRAHRRSFADVGNERRSRRHRSQRSGHALDDAAQRRGRPRRSCATCASRARCSASTSRTSRVRSTSRCLRAPRARSRVQSDFFDVDSVATGYVNGTMSAVSEDRSDARVADVRREHQRQLVLHRRPVVGPGVPLRPHLAGRHRGRTLSPSPPS